MRSGSIGIAHLIPRALILEIERPIKSLGRAWQEWLDQDRGHSQPFGQVYQYDRHASRSVLASLNGSVSWMYRFPTSMTSRQMRCNDEL